MPTEGYIRITFRPFGAMVQLHAISQSYKNDLRMIMAVTEKCNLFALIFFCALVCVFHISVLYVFLGPFFISVFCLFYQVEAFVLSGAVKGVEPDMQFFLCSCVCHSLRCI